MSLVKSPSSEERLVSVTFRVPAEAQATSVDIVGEFTQWALVPMRRNADGSHEAAFDLEVGSTYRFRYLVDGKSWENDWAADNYAPNGYGGDDSVVDLRSVGWRSDGSPGSRANAAVLPFDANRRTEVATPAVERRFRTRQTRADSQ